MRTVANRWVGRVAGVVCGVGLAAASVLVGPGAAHATACGGTAWGPPFVTGPVSQTVVGVWGARGYRQPYSFHVHGNAPSPVFVEVKGYDAAYNERWYPMVVGTDGQKLVPWGNSLASPAIRASSLGPFGAEISWTC